MPMSIIQSGSALQSLADDGTLTTLTLPTGVTLDTNTFPRWQVYGQNVVLVNTPSRPLAITSDGTVRVLTPIAPRLAPILAGVAGGTLTGSFMAKETFVVTDAYGNILSESDYGPASTKVAIAAKYLGVTNIDVSSDTVSLRRLYRTTDNGAVYFEWLDVDGNIITTAQDDLADAGLSIFAAPTLGTPPRLTTIAEFRGRLFGGADTDIDFLRYTEAGLQYAWPQANAILVPGYGADSYGITALVARREALGVGRRNLLAQITGTGAQSGTDTDFDAVIVSRELGIWSQETAKVFRDTAFFLWEDGVYSWGPGGIQCVSDGSADGKGNVRSWFTTDSYFNRDKFSVAFAHIDPVDMVYRLFLASAGSDTVDSWVEYMIGDGTWFGPHTTDLPAPTSAFLRTSSTGRTLPVIGSASSVFDEQNTRTDGYNTPITFDVIGKRHDGDVPDQEKYFGELSISGAVQTSGLLQVKSITGNRDATRTIIQRYDMTKPQQRLGRLGRGKHTQIRLVNAGVGEDVVVYGYGVDPVHIVGRR